MKKNSPLHLAPEAQGKPLWVNILRYLVLSLVFLTASLQAATITSVPGVGLDWSATSTWVGGVVPTAIDDVIISNGSGVVIRNPYSSIAPANINSLTINGSVTFGAGSGVVRGLQVATFLSINPGGTLTNDGFGTTTHLLGVGGNFTNNGTFNFLVGSASIQLTINGAGAQLLDGASTQAFGIVIVNKAAGALTISNSVSTISNTNFVLTAGQVIASPNLSITGNVTMTTGTFTAGGNLFLGGNFANNGATFQAGTGTVTFNGTVQTIASTVPLVFNNLSTAGLSQATIVPATTVSGNLSIGDGTSLSVGNLFTVLGSTSVGSGSSGSLIISSASGTKTFGGPVNIKPGATWNNAISDNAHFNNGVTNEGTFIAGTGNNYFEVNPQTITGTFDIPRVVVSTNLTNNGNLTISQRLEGSGSLTQGTGALLNIEGTTAAATVLVASNPNNTVNYTSPLAQPVKGINYVNLGFSGGGLKTLVAGTALISGNFLLNGTVTSVAATPLTIGGNLSIANGASLSLQNTFTVSGTTTIGSGGSLVVTSTNGTKTFVGNFILEPNGTWDNTLSDNAHFNNGITKNGGVFIAGTAVNYFEINPQSIVGTIDIPFMVVRANVTNNGNLTIATRLEGAGSLTQGPNAVLNVAGSIAGATQLNATSAVNTVNFISTLPQNVKGVNYNNLGLTGGGVKTLTLATTSVSGNLTLDGPVTASTVVGLAVGGDLLVANGTVFNINGFNFSVGGKTTMASSGTIAFPSIIGNKQFGGLVSVEAAGIWNNTANEAVSFLGGLTNSGTFNAGTGIHTFETNPQAIGGTLTIPNALIGGVAVTNNGTFTSVSTLNGSGSIVQGPGAALTISGTSTLSSIDGSALGNTVTYNGAAPTIITGPYFNLALNQSSGVATLAGSSSVFGTLSIISGNLNIGNNNLTLGATAGISITLPSSTRMIIASTGEVRKVFPAAGSFTFPVGEISGTAQYSPITVNVTSATNFNAGYIGVSVVDSKHPSDPSVSHFLTRYWNVNQTGMGNCVATVTGTYLPVDISGIESNIYPAQLKGVFSLPSNPWVLFFPSVSGNQVTATGANLPEGVNCAFSGIFSDLDLISPSVAITSTTADLINNPLIPVTFTFTENVTGFTAADVTVTNGTIGDFSGSGTTYLANVTATGQGIVSLTVPANAATDAAANGNLASPTFTRIFDSVAPTILSITSSAPDPTNATPIPVTITFSEGVQGFALSDISVLNGTAGNLVGSGETYTADISPSGQGTVTVSIAANVATDAAGNGNTASSNFTREFNNTQPTVTISSTAPQPTKNSPIAIVITFSESVTQFIAGDITVTNGTVGGFTGTGASYNANITPIGQGEVTVSVAANVAINAATNGNTASNLLSRTYDTVQPTAIISSSASDPTNSSPIPITITFSEDVTGFTIDDLVATNATLESFSGSASNYTASVVPVGQGPVSVSMAAAVATDEATNTNAPADFDIVYDNIAPTVQVTSLATNPTNVSPIPVTITFNESVTGFIVDDISVVNGSADGFSGSGTTYTVNITPMGQGTVTVSVGANAAADQATNGNATSNIFTRVFDNSAPTVIISSTSANPTKVTPIPVTITFSEVVTGFISGDIQVTNGSISGFAGSGAIYTANIIPASLGQVAVSIGADAAFDATANGNLPSSTLTREFDNAQPAVSITSSASQPTNGDPIPITITFSESVTGFALTDITITNGTADDFSGSGASYTANITPSGQGTVTASVPAEVALDEATNGNAASGIFTRQFDSVSPTVSITSTTTDPTNATIIPITITFSETVTGFISDDIVVTNGSLANFAGSGTTYSADVLPTSPGDVIVSVGPNVAADQATNPNLAASDFIRVFDNLQPSVSITSTTPLITNLTPFPVTFTFSESVTGFAVGDIEVVNGAAGGLVGDGVTFTANVTPSGQGDVTVSLAANLVADAASNGNTASNNLTRTFDNARPSVLITSIVSDPTNLSTFPITITFSENVTGLGAGDIVVINGTLGNFAGSGSTYTASVTPVGQGLVTVSVAADMAEDDATNGNTTSPTFTRVYDNVGPTVTITSAAPDPTNVTPIPVTITFSESVTGFLLDDITVANGVAGDLAGSGAVYTANISPAAMGSVTVSVEANNASDAAGNPNSASNVLARVYNNVNPTVVIETSVSDPTNTAPFPIAITFSESVSGFDINDLQVTNGTPGGFAGSGADYTATIAPGGQGQVTVKIAAGAAQNAATNPNTASNTLSRIYDTVSPSLVIASTVPDPTNVATIPVTFTFSENVTGFSTGDIVLGNATLSDFFGNGAIYSAIVTPLAPGSVTVGVGAGAATDAASNGSLSAVTFSRVFDNVDPTVVSITSSAPDPTNVSPIPVTITFSENVTGFVLADIDVINGTAGNFAGSGATYTASITPALSGLVTVSVAANVAVDAPTNQNTASAPFSIVFDSDAPTVVINSISSNATNVTPIPITITFSEEVTGFIAGDITVGNGTVSNFSGSGSDYTADINPSSQGTVTVGIAANVAFDGATHGNIAALNFTRVFDSVAPTIIISSSSPNPTNTSIPIIITFSEAVTGFTVDDILVDNGSPESFAGSGTTYTVSIAPAGQGTVGVSVPANLAEDAATNGNIATAVFSVSFDNAKPTVALATSAADPTNTAPLPISITFSESVTGFVLSDIDVTNGTAANFAGSGANYTATITPTGQGLVTIRVDANVATDGAGNSNSASTDLTRVFDTSSPTVTITSSASNVTNVAIPIIISFSESVTGFISGDITVTNGSVSNFSGNGASYSADIVPTSAGLVTITIASGVATDLATNSNLALASPFTRTFDNSRPTVTITSSSPDPTGTSPIPITITFSESVSGFSLADIVVVNGTAGSFAGSGTTYTANITPAAQGTVTVSVAANTATDAANNGNTASANFTRVFDTDEPTVVITTTVLSSINTTNIPITITFSESVTGLSLGDIIVTNGVASNFAGTGAIYTARVTPTAEGAVTVIVPTNAAVNSISNGNVASNLLTVMYDLTSPTVAISSSVLDPTNATAIPIMVTFSESVTGFVVGDITVTNGTVANFASSGSVFTANVTPTTQGTVTVSVAANVAADLATNGNTASTNFTRTFDSVGPSVTIASSSPDPTYVTPIPISITFSEAVSGFSLSDIAVTNGAAGGLTGSGAAYTASVTPSAFGVVTVTVGANLAFDAAANGNAASTSFTRAFQPPPTDQTITFPSIASKTLGDAAFNISATASSGLPVSFSSTSDKIIITGTLVTMTKAGSVTITANQSGNSSFNPAPPVNQTFCINPTKPTISMTGDNTETVVLTSSSTTGNQWSKDGSPIAGQTSQTLNVTSVGSYSVTVTVEGCTSAASNGFPVVVTDIEEAKRSGTLTLFPNPAEETVNITWGGFLPNQEIEVRVIDFTGRSTMIRMMSTSERQINVRELASGQYIFQARQNTATKSVRFLRK
jgi:Bacterial Ig-like domain/Secretion system C-terminal sorting domain